MDLKITAPISILNKLSNRNLSVTVNVSQCTEGEQLSLIHIFRELERGLSTGERKMLHSAKEILISEIVLSQSCTYEDVEARINTALN